MDTALLHGRLYGIHCRLGVEGIKDGFHQYAVHTGLKQGAGLLLVGIVQFIIGDGTECRVVHVGTDGERFACRADGGNNIARLFCRAECLCLPFGYPYRFDVELFYQMTAMVFCLRDTLAAEGVGGDDVRPGFQIAAVYVADDIGACKAQQVVVALHICSFGQIQVAPEVLFHQAVGLYQRAHGAVKQQYPVLE